MKKFPDYQIRISIDGEFVPVGTVGILLQSDPFPGGHRYTLRILNFDAQRSSTLPRGEFVSPSRELCSSASLLVSSKIDQTSAFQNIEVEALYLINTIEELTVEESEFFMEGVCSPVVRV